MVPECSVAYGGATKVGTTDLYTPGTLPLVVPLDAIYGVSTNITAGLQEGAICDSDPYLVFDLAITTASLPPPPVGAGTGAAVCRYTNWEYTLTCPTKVGANAFALTADSKLRTITIAAGAFDGTSVAAANAQAEAFASAVLLCEFGSPAMQIRCGATAPGSMAAANYPNAGGTTVTPLVLGSGIYGTPASMVSPRSIGHPSTEIVMALHAFRSTDSPMAAFLQAYQTGTAGLFCFFDGAGTATCTPMPDNRTVMTDGRVNGLPFLSVGDGLLDGTGPGQVARFKYAGEIDPPDGSRPRVVHYGTTTPYANGVATSTISQADANALALADAASKLDCTHTNWTRTNYRCPRTSDIRHVAYISYMDSFEGVSTEAANSDAEQYAIARTVCGECAPFRMISFDPTLPDVAPPQGEVFKMCPGTATFWGLNGSSTGLGAKLLACNENSVDSFGIRRIRNGDCSGATVTTLPHSGGTELYWLKVTCCPKTGGGTEPALILMRSNGEGYTENDIKPDPNTPSVFYPEAESTTLNADPEAAYIYVGAVVSGRTETLDGRTTAVYQAIDENLQLFGSAPGGGGGNNAFYRVYVDGANWMLQGGQVVGDAGVVAPYTGLVGAIELGTVAAADAEDYDGQSAWLKITGNGSVVDGRLWSGFKVSAAIKAAVGAITLPTVALPTGRDYFLLLGTWVGTEFHPSSAGHVSLEFCAPGSYTVSRF
jgi:hypothetical protein